MTRHRVVIVGGGFAGLYAAKSLRRAPVDVTVIDRRNFHLFQPLLYQVATGGLSPGDITSPIRSVLKRQRNARVLLSEVTRIDTARRCVNTGAGEIPFDSLVIATGVSHHYFGNDTWADAAPGLKSIEDATAMRGRILYAFEAAEAARDERERQTWLTFVVVGAGPTGVELAGALGELAHHTLKHDFRAIDPREARVVLVEGTNRVLPTYPPTLSSRARRSLERLGVSVRTETLVRDIGPDHVTVESHGQSETIQSRCVLWAAGVRASPLGQAVHDATGAPLDRVGRVVVEPDLTVPGHPDIAVIGDLANFSHQRGEPLPGVAPVAMQQGRYVARRIVRRLKDRSVPPFRYFDKGNLATIGRRAAVADFGRVRVSGSLAWLLWLGVHIAFLIEFENRLLVLIQWAWSYFTRKRGARLIAGEPPSQDAHGGVEPGD